MNDETWAKLQHDLRLEFRVWWNLQLNRDLENAVKTYTPYQWFPKFVGPVAQAGGRPEFARKLLGYCITSCLLRVSLEFTSATTIEQWLEAHRKFVVELEYYSEHSCEPGVDFPFPKNF